MEVDLKDLVQMLLRWGHIVAGVMWIGHLWFFNFVNGPFAGTMDGPTKQKVVPELMPRALFWFRWGAASLPCAAMSAAKAAALAPSAAPAVRSRATSARRSAWWASTQ